MSKEAGAPLDSGLMYGTERDGPDDQVLDINEVAAIIRLAPKTIRDQISQGRCRIYSWKQNDSRGGRRQFWKSGVYAYLENAPTEWRRS